MRRLIAVPLVALVVLALTSPALGDDAKIDKSKNVTHVKQFAYKGGTELAASGDYVYSGELDGADDRGQNPKKGGMHIFDVSGKTPREVGFLHCPGNDNDVEVVRPGLAVMGFHNNLCAPSAGNGFVTIDVSNPRKPRILGAINTGKNHTLKPYPGKPIVYTAGGGLSGSTGAGPAIVDVSNPRKPKIVAKPQTLTTDCHDISFFISKKRKLGFCAGAIGTGEVQIWDVSKPVAPTLVGKIHNPLIQYSHYAVASSDGKLLAIDDEAFALHECHTGQTPTGRVWIYDISNPTVPVLQSSFAAPRGGDATGIGTFPGWVPSWCLSHGLDWMPGSRNLAVTWFTGGVSVLDLSDPVAPKEAAYFQADNSWTYSALWHRGRLYTNDMGRGVDVFAIEGLKK